MLPRLTILAAAAATLVATPALAGPRTQSVGFGDLNLASAEGRAALDARVDRAARNVCQVGIATDLPTFMASKTCYRNSVSDARDAVAKIVSSRVARVEVASR